MICRQRALCGGGAVTRNLEGAASWLIRAGKNLIALDLFNRHAFAVIGAWFTALSRLSTVPSKRQTFARADTDPSSDGHSSGDHASCQRPSGFLDLRLIRGHRHQA